MIVGTIASIQKNHLSSLLIHAQGTDRVSEDSNTTPKSAWPYTKVTRFTS